MALQRLGDGIGCESKENLFLIVFGSLGWKQ
jgi:hypothetical protein